MHPSIQTYYLAGAAGGRLHKIAAAGAADTDPVVARVPRADALAALARCRAATTDLFIGATDAFGALEVQARHSEARKNAARYHIPDPSGAVEFLDVPMINLADEDRLGGVWCHYTTSVLAACCLLNVTLKCVAS